MQKGINKNKFMKSLGSKWTSQGGVRKKIGPVVGSLNKKPQIEHLGEMFRGMSQNQAKREMLKMGLSPTERKRFIETNDELSRVFGMEKEGTKPLSKQEKRRLLKKEEMHKKFNIKSSRNIAGDIKNKKKNRLDGIYNKKEGTAKDYGYATVEDEGHHKATALGEAKGSVSITKSGNDSVVGGSSATGLTGGAPGGVSKSGRPVGL